MVKSGISGDGIPASAPVGVVDDLTPEYTLLGTLHPDGPARVGDVN